MKLFKNVDVVDLESIIANGILSMAESGNYNWSENKRVNNSTDVVYLFKPLSEHNSFCNYGVALLEIEIPDNAVVQNQMGETDVNNGKYIEYTTAKVSPEQITNIYIPELFAGRLSLPENVANKITYVEMKANWYSKNGKEICPPEILNRFSQTAQFENASYFNFFRGITESNTMIDLYDIQYVIN